MGELLRRYWWPVATHDMATRVPVKRRLLGEDLVLYRDGSGTVGLLAEQCPHRRAALWLGCTEDVGLRCGYHGWRFDADGRCLEQPGEPADSTFKDRVRATAYPVRELGGLVFAYLGPRTPEQPVPALPRYDLFVWDDACSRTCCGWAPRGWRRSRSGCRSTTRTPGTSGTRPTGPRAAPRPSPTSRCTRCR